MLLVEIHLIINRIGCIILLSVTFLTGPSNLLVQHYRYLIGCCTAWWIICGSNEPGCDIWSLNRWSRV